MQIRYNKIQRMSLQAFADLYSLTMEINERDKTKFPSLAPYYASFDGCEVKDGSVLAGVYGNGSSPQEAMIDYTKRISGKRLVFYAGSKQRFELNAPILYFERDNAASKVVD